MYKYYTSLILQMIYWVFQKCNQTLECSSAQFLTTEIFFHSRKLKLTPLSIVKATHVKRKLHPSLTCHEK